MISVQRLTKPIRLYEQITSTLSILSNKFRKWYPSITLLEPISKLHVSKVVKCSVSHHSKATELCSRKSYFRPLCWWKDIWQTRMNWYQVEKRNIIWWRIGRWFSNFTSVWENSKHLCHNPSWRETAFKSNPSNPYI